MIVTRTIAATAPSWMHNVLLPVRRLLSLSSDQADFRTRGFAGRNQSRQSALELIGRTFIAGYNAAIAAHDVEDILQHIDDVPQPERGFAVEGAAMGAAVIDAILLRQSLLPACVRAFRHDFTYLVHVGAGWSLARVPWRRRQILTPLDSVHRWLAFDGLGFHDTYFHHRRVLGGWRRTSSGYSARAYDQGVGRALWFVAGGSVEDVIDFIAELPAPRRSDLWSGLGLAMAYAGPVSADEIACAFQSAGPQGVHYAQGIAFACEARALARHVPDHTELAARAVWGHGAQALSTLVREVRDHLPEIDVDCPRYELWRQRTAAAFQRTPELRS